MHRDRVASPAPRGAVVALAAEAVAASALGRRLDVRSDRTSIFGINLMQFNAIQCNPMQLHALHSFPLFSMVFPHSVKDQSHFYNYTST
jgi:hypothetical protein